MLDLYKLQIFSVVVQEGSFSGAGERLLMTQSGISQHIQDLERTLGTMLFERGRRGVTPTAAGRTLYEYSRTILKLVAEAENAVTTVQNLPEGQLVIGATPGISVYLMPEWVQSFRARYPNLTVGVQTHTTPEIVALLRTGRLDLGFVEGELDERHGETLGALLLMEVEQQVMIGAKHPWWGRGVVSLEELNGQSFIMRQRESQSRLWLDEILQAHGVKPKVMAEFDNLESIKRAVIGGSCLTILPDYVVGQEQILGLIQTLAIKGTPLRRILKMIWLRERFFSPITHAFLNHIRQMFPHILPQESK